MECMSYYEQNHKLPETEPERKEWIIGKEDRARSKNETSEKRNRASEMDYQQYQLRLKQNDVFVNIKHIFFGVILLVCVGKVFCR